MNAFVNSLTGRRIVHTLLLVWIFALGSGLANACLLQQSGTHGHGPSGDGQPTSQAPRVSPGHLGADSDHLDNAGLAKSACLKVCGDGAQTIVKWAVSADVADVAMASPTVLAWSAPLDTAEQSNAWFDLPDPSPGVPVRTRFSRLAL